MLPRSVRDSQKIGREIKNYDFAQPASRRPRRAAVAVVWSRMLRQPLIFPKKNAHSRLWWGTYARFLREERGAPPGAQIAENVMLGTPDGVRESRRPPRRRPQVIRGLILGCSILIILIILCAFHP